MLNNLSIFLEKQDVENRWMQNSYVNWLTGLPACIPDPDDSFETHCSAFVSSVCYQLGVPMLIPPYVKLKALLINNANG